MKKFFFGVFILLMANRGIGQSYIDSVKQEIVPYIEKQMRKKNIKGISIALVDNQEIVWAQGFGNSDETIRMPATEQTTYRIGSVSKLFVATAIMQLQEQSLLNIDSSIIKYIPEFSILSDYGNYRDITVRQLLTHHSGLPGDILNGMFADSVGLPESILPTLKKMHTAYSPNFIFAYSNIGFSLLGIIIERVSGLALDEYMKKNIYEPLQMQYSSFEMPNNIKKFYSKAYVLNKEIKEAQIREKAAGMMVSNVLDMSQFIKSMIAIQKNEPSDILSYESFVEMTKPQNEAIIRDLDLKMGLSWFLNTPEELKFAGSMISHGGDTQAFHSQLAILKEKKMGLVLLSNTDNFTLIREKLMRKIFLSVLKYKFHEIPEPKVHEKRVKSVSTNKFERFIGYYASPIGLIQFSSKKRFLETNIQGYHAKFYPKADSSFITKIQILGIKLALKNEKFGFKILDTDTVLIHNRRILGLKVFPKQIDSTWSSYYGNYENLDIGVNRFYPESVSFFEKNGFLQLKMKIAGSKANFILEPLSSTDAKILGLGRNMNEHVYFTQKDGNFYIHYSGFQLVLQK